MAQRRGSSTYLIPLVFGLGSPLVAIVVTCIGAGMRERALHATWVGATIAFLATELIELTAALCPMHGCRFSPVIGASMCMRGACVDMWILSI
jgi:hypothetical protein